jgi:putative Mg2+ transporter-C (MgtC) family protein
MRFRAGFIRGPAGRYSDAMNAGQFDALNTESGLLVQAAAKRMLMACALGGLIGLEREWRHKDSGLRTNMLICMAAALFTLMSEVLAGASTPNKGQVASNIVQGVGFLGAGLILHGKSRILGLTSAATVFVVAAIGMTCGAGLYGEATLATAIVLLALALVGSMEVKLGWKRYPMLYEVRANVGSALAPELVGQARAEALAEQIEQARHRMYTAILAVLDRSGIKLDVLNRDTVAGLERISFWVLATRRRHTRMLAELRASDATDQVVTYQDEESE